MKKRQSIELNITPLIDIIFILFTFFLVATSFKQKESELNIQLPTTADYSEHQNRQNAIKVTLSKERLQIESAETNNISLLNKMEESIKKISKNNHIEIRIDAGVDYQKISTLLSLLKKYHLNDISLITLDEK